jgi:hypothetical protein
MGEYRFSIYTKKQIGLMLVYQYGQLNIKLPFIDIYLSFNKEARGTNF